MTVTSASTSPAFTSMDAHWPDVDAVRWELEMVIAALPTVRVLKWEMMRNGMRVYRLADGEG